MKKTTTIITALLLLSMAGFAQSKKSTTKTIARPDVPASVVQATATTSTGVAPLTGVGSTNQYLISLSEPELVGLLTFIQNSDNYSEKGKALFLDELKKKVHLIPTIPADTTAGKK